MNSKTWREREGGCLRFLLPAYRVGLAVWTSGWRSGLGLHLEAYVDLPVDHGGPGCEILNRPHIFPQELSRPQYRRHPIHRQRVRINRWFQLVCPFTKWWSIPYSDWLQLSQSARFSRSSGLSTPSHDLGYSNPDAWNCRLCFNDYSSFPGGEFFRVTFKYEQVLDQVADRCSTFHFFHGFVPVESWLGCSSLVSL